MKRPSLFAYGLFCYAVAAATFASTWPGALPSVRPGL